MGFVGLWKNPEGPSMLTVLGGGRRARRKTEQGFLPALCASSECVWEREVPVSWDMFPAGVR